MTDKDSEKVIGFLTKVIKHNKQLIHLDLTSTGLNEAVVREVGTSLRRATSLLAIHLSGNPGMTAYNLEFLPRRIRVRPNEDMDRFKRIQSAIWEFMKE
jgi:hypothetical protein